MIRIIISFLFLFLLMDCGNKDNKTNEAEVVIEKKIPEPELKVSKPLDSGKLKVKIKPGSDENTLIGITYKSKNEIPFLKDFKEIGGMVLSGSMSKGRYSMAFFEKPGAKLALLEECFTGITPHYKILDRVMIRVKRNIGWQYDPAKNVCALIGDKLIGENKYAAEKAWKIQTINGKIKIAEINPAKVYFQTLFGTNALISGE